MSQGEWWFWTILAAGQAMALVATFIVDFRQHRKRRAARRAHWERIDAFLAAPGESKQ